MSQFRLTRHLFTSECVAEGHPVKVADLISDSILDAIISKVPKARVACETLLTTGRARIARWRKGLFSFLSRNARPPTAFFGLPPNRVVELGAQIEV